MPRTITGAERTQTRQRANAVRLKVEVETATPGTFADLATLNGQDYRLGATVTTSLQQVCDTATIALRAGYQSASIAPAMTSATVNAVARAIDGRRRVLVSVAVLDPAATVVSGDWKMVFDGRIDRVETRANGEQLVLQCRDRMADLLNMVFEFSGTAGTGASPLETVIQSILTAVMGGSAPTLVTPVSPAWAPAAATYRRGDSPMALITALCDQIGWVVRYRWNGNTPELRLFDPRRSMASADWDVWSGEVGRVEAFDFDATQIRNVIGIAWREGGALQSLTVLDTSSISQYGLIPMMVQEGASSQIRTSTAATRMGNAILSDLKSPPLSETMRTRHPFWFVEAGDILDIQPNGVTHDASQRLAAITAVHEFTDGGGSSRIDMRGAPTSRGRDWLAYGVPDTVPVQDIGRLSQLDGVRSGATYTAQFRLWNETGAEVTTNPGGAVFSVATTSTTAGGTVTTSAATATWNTGLACWEVAVTQAAGATDRVLVTLLPDALTGRASVDLPAIVLPFYAGAGAGARFTSCTVTVTNGSGSAGAPVTLAFAVADAPSGYTVNALVEIDAAITALTAITSGVTLTTGRLTSAGGFIVAYTVRGSITMQDSAGNIIASRAIPPTNYFGA